MEPKRHLRRFWSRNAQKSNAPSISPQALPSKASLVRKTDNSTSERTGSGSRGKDVRFQTSQSHGQVSNQATSNGTLHHGLEPRDSGVSTSSLKPARTQDQKLGPNFSRPMLNLNKIDLTLRIESSCITLGSTNGASTGSIRNRHSEDVADRNMDLAKRSSNRPTTARSVDILDRSLPGYPQVLVEKRRYSEDVADRNIDFMRITNQSNSRHTVGDGNIPGAQASFGHNSKMRGASTDYVRPDLGGPVKHTEPVPWKESKARPNGSIARATDTSRGHSYVEPRVHTAKRHTGYTQVEPLERTDSSEGQVESCNESIQNLESSVSSLRLSPSRSNSQLSTLLKLGVGSQGASPVRERGAWATSERQANDNDRVKAEVQSRVPGINLTDSVDTEVKTKYAPTVTHETITPTIRHVREEQITREVHTYDVFHRILPIKEVEVLPARHYIPAPYGELQEVPASTVPASDGSAQVLHSISKTVDNEKTLLWPAKFTASTLDGFDEDYEARVDADGVTRSRTTWIHPPTLANGPS